jgi:plasmid stabilization system protein ParE
VNLAYRVRILPGALQDAKNYYKYIEEDSPGNAVNWFNGLFDVVDSLAMMPKRCPVAPETSIVGQEVRCLLYCKYYRILYSIEERVVRIYHIRHTSQEYMSREEFFAQPSQGFDDDM